MNKRPYIVNLDRIQVENKYKELKNIKAVALYFNIDPCTMSRYFRRLGISYIKKHKNNFNENFFAQDTPESFYLAGFIAADGNLSKTKNRIKIELSEIDLCFLEKIKDLIQFEGNLYKRAVLNSKRNIFWKDTNNYSLVFSSKQVATDLNRFNIVPAKTKIYEFPSWLVNHILVSHFMRGYFDGDGHIGLKVDKKLRFELSGNFNFLKTYQSILENNCNIHHNQILIRKNGLSSLEYQGNIIVPKICEFLYNNSTFHLDRKYDIYKNWEKL